VYRGRRQISKAAVTEAVQLAARRCWTRRRPGSPLQGGVNLLDENLPLDQRDLLRTWGIHCR